MNNLDYKTITIAVILSVLVTGVINKTGLRLGSTITTTNSSDTLETFRTNVNASLTSLQQFASTTNLTGLSATIGGSASTTLTSTGKVGIASTTPFGDLGIGAGTATSTISGGKFCAYFKDETGRGLFLKLATSSNQVFATSTQACNQ